MAGNSYTEKTKNGINYYRKDGSILFGSLADGVKYMRDATIRDTPGLEQNKDCRPMGWANCQIEQFGFVNNNSILVTPSQYNDAETSRPHSAGYKIMDGAYFDPLVSNYFPFKATIHTHGEGGDAGPSDDDYNA